MCTREVAAQLEKVRERGSPVKQMIWTSALLRDSSGPFPKGDDNISSAPSSTCVAFCVDSGWVQTLGKHCWLRRYSAVSSGLDVDKNRTKRKNGQKTPLGMIRWQLDSWTHWLLHVAT